MKLVFHIIFSVLLVFHCAVTQAQRPKIGVTLSGGGAKGLIHVGILQAIDSAGLKVDYITGTSMGSVVGGMYAAGYSGDSIEAIARKLDWELLFSTQPQLDLISIEEKDEFNKYALEVPFQEGKFKIGKGIIAGQELWLKFAEVFLPVYNITDFNKLPIPFACIGTDLSTGDAVVMDHGNIISAIRASMAIPSVFTPVKYDGKTLVDGGVVNNFPVLDAKKMGADYVIGVNLNEGLEKAEDLETMFDVLLQLAFFKDAITFDEHKKACNIYIQPDLEGYSTGDFAYSDSIIDIGKKWGRMYYPIFKHLADSLNAIYPDTVPFVKNKLPEFSGIKIENYSVDGLKRTSEEFFFGLSGLKSSKKYEAEKVAESIRNIYGSRYYKIVQYDFVNRDSGKTDMQFKVEENPLTAVKFALNYNNYTKLSLIGNITTRDLLFKESRALVTASLSENPRFIGEYFKYLGKHRRFGANFSLYRETVDYPVFEDFDLFETLRHSLTVYDFRIQYAINRLMYIGVAQQYNNSTLRTKESPDLDVNGKNKFWHTYLTYRMNNVDKRYFSTHGWRISMDAGFVYDQKGKITLSNDTAEINADTMAAAFDNSFRIHGRVENFTSLSPKLTFIKQVSFSFLSSRDTYLPNSFQVGGIADNIANQVLFAGLDESQVKTGSIGALQLGLQWKATKSVYLTGRANVGLYDFHKDGLEDVTVDDNFLSGYSLTAGLMTPIGPIEISAMYSDQDGQVRTNLNIGYRFR